jgi:hypothetical protein
VKTEEIYKLLQIHKIPVEGISIEELDSVWPMGEKAIEQFLETAIENGWLKKSRGKVFRIISEPVFEKLVNIQKGSQISLDNEIYEVIEPTGFHWLVRTTSGSMSTIPLIKIYKAAEKGEL